MSKRSPLCFLTLALASAVTGACGSRTPLKIEPSAIDAAPPEGGRDSAPDVAVVPGCIMGSRAIGEIQIDLYFSLDRSRSMETIDLGSTKTRWQSVSSAMTTFVNSSLSAGLGAGIAFFPRSTAGGGPYCATADYAFPVVPIGLLPGVAPSILTAISFQTLGAGTPTSPALEGAHVYARSRQVALGDHTAAVVLVTDGVPRDCNSTIPGTSAAAAAAAAGSPPIRTYVLGVGPSLGNLNAIAKAGATEQAYLVESSGEGALLTALETIRTSALQCEYVFPPNGGAPPTFDDVRVKTVLGADGASTAIAEVPNAEACAGGPGWFYDNPIPPGDPPPTKILLCPASCNPLVHSKNNQMSVAIDCPAR